MLYRSTVRENVSKIYFSRSIVHMHKYDVTPPEYIYIHIRFQGDKNSPAIGACHLIAYGIEFKQSDVDSDVFDALMVLDNGKINLTVCLVSK